LNALQLKIQNTYPKLPSLRSHVSQTANSFSKAYLLGAFGVSGLTQETNEQRSLLVQAEQGEGNVNCVFD
jgi:hypothetical protein